MFSKRPSLPADFSIFGFAFKPLYPLGKNGKLISAENAIQQRMCHDALKGKRKSIAVLLRIAEAKEAEWIKRQCYVVERRTKRDRERRATTAMLLLSVASRAMPDGAVALEPWVSDLALCRDGAPSFEAADRERIERHTRAPDTPAPEAFRLPPPEPRQSRSPEETRFKKGQSGNPKGRPKKEPELPFSEFFDEIGTMRIHGKDVRMTRLQSVLCMLDRKAIDGDSCMTAVLGGKYMRARLERYKRGEHIRHEAPLHDARNLPARIARDPFEQMLRYFRITNGRTKTRVLIEPWVVEAALKRFGERRLTKEEQAEVLRSASKPSTINWPAWWEIRTHADAKPYRPVQPRLRRVQDDYDPRIM